MDYGIYIHIPFCRSKCHYCDFPSYADRAELMPAYADALTEEIRRTESVCRARGSAPATIYIGGGTPTALGKILLTKIIRAVIAHLGVSDTTEFTVEANPGTVEPDFLRILRRLDVNRLSLGGQSFNDTILKTLGRIHNAADASATIRAAKIADFANISLDLMYGLPGQTFSLWQETLQQAVGMGVTHISAYGLQIEEGTEFARQRQEGKLQLPTDEAEEQMYDYMTDFLPAHGYARYEISNFARPGFHSRHNLGYWQNVPYLGLGSAAHSYWENRRWQNVTDPAAYIARVNAGKSPAEADELRSDADAMAEFAFLALRTAAGISRAKFKDAFGRSLDEVYASPIRDLTERGLIIDDISTVRLTKLGCKWGNIAFAAFLP